MLYVTQFHAKNKNSLAHITQECSLDEISLSDGHLIIETNVNILFPEDVLQLIKEMGQG